MDFDKIIAASKDSGMSHEDIAKAVSEALNRSLQQETEDKKTPRDKVLEHFENTFDKHYKESHLTIADIGALLTLSIAQDTDEGKKMEAAEMEDLYDFCCSYIASTLISYKMHRTFITKKNEARAHLSELSKMAQDFVRAGTDRNCKCGKHEAKHPTPKIDKVTDTEKIEEFLRDIFR